MNVPLVNDLSKHIRRVDGDNELSGAQLGASIAGFLRERGVPLDAAKENGIEDFVHDANTGVGYRHPKRLTGSALAEALVTEFKLSEEG